MILCAAASFKLHARHLVTEPVQSRLISSRADLTEQKSSAEEKVQLTRKIQFWVSN